MLKIGINNAKGIKNTVPYLGVCGLVPAPPTTTMSFKLVIVVHTVYINFVGLCMYWLKISPIVVEFYGVGTIYAGIDFTHCTLLKEHLHLLYNLEIKVCN